MVTAEAVRKLVDGGVPVDSTDRYGSTALLMATANGQLEVVKVLVELGADIDHKEGFYGADALGMALFRGHPAIAGFLLQQGADDRATVLQVGLQEGNVDLAKAAVEAGPIYASRLEAIKARSADLSPELSAILAAAESRPDPEPPAYTNVDLQPYIGAFEGWNSDTRVEASVEGDALLLSVNGGEPIKMAVLAEKSFSSPDGEIEANFFGRAGSVEGIGLRIGEKAPESLRRSVAEPAGATAYSYADKSDWTLERMTVNWPSFRGQNALGIGDGKDALTDWDLDSGEGVAWQTDLVGLGNSSPVVWGDQIFVTTASVDGEQTGIRTGLTGAGDSIDEEVEHSWRVVAHDKKTGQELWSTEVGRGCTAFQTPLQGDPGQFDREPPMESTWWSCFPPPGLPVSGSTARSTGSTSWAVSMPALSPTRVSSGAMPAHRFSTARWRFCRSTSTTAPI